MKEIIMANVDLTWFADDLAVDDPQGGLRAHVFLVAVGRRVVESAVKIVILMVNVPKRFLVSLITYYI